MEIPTLYKLKELFALQDQSPLFLVTDEIPQTHARVEQYVRGSGHPPGATGKL